MEYLKRVNNDVVLTEEICVRTRAMLKDIERLKRQEKELREALKEIMEGYNIKKFDNDILSVQYIEETHREMFDKKKLQEINPDLYDECIKILTVAPTVRIKLKDEE